MFTMSENWSTMQGNIPLEPTNEQYDLNRVFRFEMQPIPPEQTDMGTVTTASETAHPQRVPVVPQLTPLSIQSSIPTTMSNSIDLGFMQAIYIPELADDFMESVEETTPQDQQLVIPMFNMPVLDSFIREMSRLNSLRDFITSSPAIVWNFYELFPKYNRSHTRCIFGQ